MQALKPPKLFEMFEMTLTFPRVPRMAAAMLSDLFIFTLGIYFESRHQETNIVWNLRDRMRVGAQNTIYCLPSVGAI